MAPLGSTGGSQEGTMVPVGTGGGLVSPSILSANVRRPILPPGYMHPCVRCSPSPLGGVHPCHGPSFGGAVGAIFFLAQSVASSMYIVGWAEAVVMLQIEKGVGIVFPDDIANSIRFMAFCCLIVMFAMAFAGVGWLSKMNMVLLFFLVSVRPLRVRPVRPEDHRVLRRLRCAYWCRRQ